MAWRGKKRKTKTTGIMQIIKAVMVDWQVRDQDIEVSRTAGAIGVGIAGREVEIYYWQDDNIGGTEKRHIAIRMVGQPVPQKGRSRYIGMVTAETGVSKHTLFVFETDEP